MRTVSLGLPCMLKRVKETERFSCLKMHSNFSSFLLNCHSEIVQVIIKCENSLGKMIIISAFIMTLCYYNKIIIVG